MDDESLVADALASLDAQGVSCTAPFRRAGLRHLPADVAAELLREEAADALESSDDVRPDRIVKHLFETEGRTCVSGPLTLTTEEGITVRLGGGPGRMLVVPIDPRGDGPGRMLAIPIEPREGL